MRRPVLLSFALLGLVAQAGLAQPVELTPPQVAASVDESDNVATTTFNGLIRKTTSAEDRAIQEYDVSQFAGQSVISARIRGRVAVNNSFDNGPRLFDISVYAGDGVATADDFDSTSTVVGSASYAPPTDTFFEFDFDCTAEVAAIIDAGGSWVGIRVTPTSVPNFPNILDDDAGDAVLVIEVDDTPSCLADLSSPNNPGSPDGVLTGADFFEFLDRFAAGDLSIDFSSPTDPGVPDGVLTGADFFEFLDLFSQGC